MSRQKTNRLRVLSHFIVGYMLLAFLWWAILLISKNNEAYKAKMTLMQVEQQKTETPVPLKEEMEALERYHLRQRNMIIGEGLVFVVALFIGIWFINRGYTREIDIIQQKRNFLLAITHELKSPLASIRLILETFKKRTLGRDDQDNLSIHGLQETERLATLVNNLLLSARLDRSYDPVIEIADIGEIIESVILDIQKAHPAQPIETDLPSRPVTGKIDRTGMYSTIYNLIENGIKYGGAGNEILIKLRDLDRKYSVQICDQGIGIPPEERHRVFEQFYRAGQEDTRKTKGTGIGLYIVARMVELHGGTIEISDNQPRGTIFTITLPKRMET